MKVKRYRLLKVAGLLVLLSMIVFGLLQTPMGKQMLAARLSDAFSSNGVQVNIGRIRGWIPSRVQVDRIEIADVNGVWLSVEDVHGHWMMRDLFTGRIRLSKLGAKEVSLLRIPKSRRTGASQRPDSDGLRNMEIVLEGWQIDRLRLGEDVAGVALEYGVQSGGIMLTGGQLSGDLTISGDAVGQIEFNTMSGNGEGRKLMLRAEWEEVHKPTFGMDHLSGAWEATVSADGLDAVIEADLISGDLDGRFSGQINYAERTLKMSALRFSGNEYVAEGQTQLVFGDSQVDVSLNASLTDRNGLSYALDGSGRVYTAGEKSGRLEIQSLGLNAWELVSFSVSGWLSPEQLSLDVSLDEFAVNKLPFDFASRVAGNARGAVSIQGETTAPDVAVSLELSRFSSSARTLDELPVFDYRIAAGISNGQLSASTVITNFASGYFSANASMPCGFSIYPFRFDPQYKQVDGSLDAVLDLSVFNGLAMMANQRVDGLLSAELSVEDSIPSGFLLIEDSAYEHYDWGILFKDFEAMLEAKPGGFTIKSAHATDGADGRLNMTGGLGSGGWGITLELSNAEVIRRPEVNAVISGKVDLTGPFSHPGLTGTLVVDRAELLPDNILTGRPRLLEDYDAEYVRSTAAERESRKPLPLDLDLRVELPDQVYVNASMIDSVWGGSLRVRSSIDGYSVKGRIEPRRGFVAFIGKQFRFQDGSVDFDSSLHTVPVMNNLSAEYSRSDITARLILNGSVDDPQFRLESSPALPQDEILSQVLFNRDASSITPYQAIQIATAARQLSSGLSGPGFMYQFRQAVGVDTLEWREPETADGSSSVAAGKYFTPELYVEVSSTFGEKAVTDLIIEYEISRHFSVETSTGPQLRPGIGLNWRLDY